MVTLYCRHISNLGNRSFGVACKVDIFFWKLFRAKGRDYPDEKYQEFYLSWFRSLEQLQSDLDSLWEQFTEIKDAGGINVRSFKKSSGAPRSKKKKYIFRTGLGETLAKQSFTLDNLDVLLTDLSLLRVVDPEHVQSVHKKFYDHVQSLEQKLKRLEKETGRV